jgi:uncharacterized membrane protein YedE/YeeE
MESFTLISALVGGCLIGAGAGLFLWLDGRIAGVSGIFGGLLEAKPGDRAWRVAFLAGLILGPVLYGAVVAHPIAFAITPSVPILVVAGLLVGFGTRLGNGCTSGHGVCGLARFSKRSIVATASFLATAVVTCAVVRHLIGM